MKILSAEQIREADKHTINNEPVSSIDLMERAAKACFERIIEIFHNQIAFDVFCGKGNNGGDGLAIARMLAQAGKKVNVFIIGHSAAASEDFTTNLHRIQQQNKANIHFISDEKELNNITPGNSLIIDALLGTGINKSVEGLLKETINILNNSKCYIISIDLPSGMIPDGNNQGRSIVYANLTLSFQCPKYAFMFPENTVYFGRFEILDIGLDQKFMDAVPSKNFYTDEYLIQHLLLHRAQSAHKGNFGHALLVCGSKGKIGAAQLAAKACLRSGAGLLTVHVPACANDIMQIAIPEAMVSISGEEDFITDLPDVSHYNAIGAGCGMGTEKQTANTLKLLIQNSSRPLVLDADAINILAENKTWLAFLPKYSILTPHPKEFDRISGKHTDSFDRLHSAKELAAKFSIIIVLKGMHTAVVMPEGNVFFNSTGNAGLAKGGSGDTLTGIITGLLARGYAPNHAAVFGVYLHGLAADVAIQTIHPEALLASDVINCIPEAFEAVYR